MSSAAKLEIRVMDYSTLRTMRENLLADVPAFDFHLESEGNDEALVVVVFDLTGRRLTSVRFQGPYDRHRLAQAVEQLLSAR